MTCVVPGCPGCDYCRGEAHLRKRVGAEAEKWAPVFSFILRQDVLFVPPGGTAEIDGHTVEGPVFLTGPLNIEPMGCDRMGPDADGPCWGCGAARGEPCKAEGGACD